MLKYYAKKTYTKEINFYVLVNILEIYANIVYKSQNKGVTT